MKLKSTWIPFILSFLAVMGIRVYQFINIGNASVRVQWDNLDLACIIISAVAVVFIIIMSYLSKDAPKIFVLNKDAITGVLGGLTGLMIIWSSINELMIYLSFDRDLIRLFLGIFGIAAALAFIVMACCSIKGKDYFEKYRILTLIPTIWALIKLLKIFFTYNSIPTNISNIASSLDEIFVLFFLFNQARLFAGLFNPATFKKVFYFGFAAILFIVAYNTRDLLSLTDAGRKIAISSLISITTEIVFAFYILCFISSIKTGKNLDSEYKEVYDEGTPEYADAGIEGGNNNKDMQEVDALIEEIKNEDDVIQNEDQQEEQQEKQQEIQNEDQQEEQQEIQNEDQQEEQQEIKINEEDKSVEITDENQGNEQ